MKHRLHLYIYAFLALLMLLSLSACGRKAAAESEPIATPGYTAPLLPEQDSPSTVPEVAENAPVYVCINELMPSNKSTLADGAGAFPDWIELYNFGSDPAELIGCTICCDDSSWALPQLTLQPDEYRLILCSSSAGGELNTDFSLPKEGASVSLKNFNGQLIDGITYSAADGDMSFMRDDNGGVVSCSFPSPGFENSLDGYAAYQASRSCSSPIVINEVMTYNEWYVMKEKHYYDWVELKNVSAEGVNLSGYFLSDSGSERNKYQLPDVTVEPGETYLIYCTDDSTLKFVGNAPFALSAERDELFLSSSDGSLCDYASLHDIRYGGSVGRMDGQNGFFYFDAPTPDNDNADGAYCMAEKPMLLGNDGVFNDVSGVTVELSSPGTIHYTLDGSVPTAESEVYTGALTLTSTTALRAVSFEDGRLPSETLTASFVINENHTVPVVSLVMEPGDFKGGNGIYSNPKQDWERCATVSLYEDSDGFTIDCGVKLHGATSKVAQSKKSLKLNFRSRYDGELFYDLFGNDVTDFASILLRAAQEDVYSTQMRDNLMHQLAITSFPELPAQDYKYAALYINGEYWGLYNIREAHSETHFANHFDYNADTITQWKEAWPNTGDVYQFCNFALKRDMSKDENYAQVAEHLDIDSIIGWSIIEAYSGNIDCHSPNMRFYYSAEDQVLHFALVDLDLGMFGYDMFDVPFAFGYAYNRLVKSLINNEQFRTQLLEQLSKALTGPMSNDNVLALIDSMADEIRPEMARDRERWGGSLEKWEDMVDDLREYVTRKGGRAHLLVNSIANQFALSKDEVQQYFGDVAITE